jgi:hypothetical protein
VPLADGECEAAVVGIEPGEGGWQLVEGAA